MNAFRGKDELMRKAKVAALIFGGVSTCLLGGLFGVYATAPIVSSVAPNNDVENIYEVESEELANVAAVTSIRTTAITTTSKTYTTTDLSFSTYSPAVSTTTTAAVKDTLTMSASFNGASARPSYMANNTEAPTTEAPTQSYTEAPTYNYTEPVTDTWNEPATDAPVWTEPTTDAPVWTDPEPIESPTEPVTAPSPDYWDEPAEPTVSDEPVSGGSSISDEDFIILCNAVAHEAGCNWIDTFDKAKVVEVIMNRVNSPLYPNSIIGVLTQPYQFSGSSSYVYLGDYSGYVTQSVKDAVSLYFDDPGSFNHGYFGFYGDGYRNYFY